VILKGTDGDICSLFRSSLQVICGFYLLLVNHPLYWISQTKICCKLKVTHFWSYTRVKPKLSESYFSYNINIHGNSSLISVLRPNTKNTIRYLHWYLHWSKTNQFSPYSSRLACAATKYEKYNQIFTRAKITNKQQYLSRARSNQIMVYRLYQLDDFIILLINSKQDLGQMHKYQPHATNWTAHSRSDLESKIGQRQSLKCAMFKNFSQLEQC
jgi:hypothetical protein